MMGGPVVLDRIVSLQAARLRAIATEDGRVQIEGMSQRIGRMALKETRIRASDTSVVRRYVKP